MARPVSIAASGAARSGSEEWYRSAACRPVPDGDVPVREGMGDHLHPGDGLTIYGASSSNGMRKKAGKFAPFTAHFSPSKAEKNAALTAAGVDI